MNEPQRPDPDALLRTLGLAGSTLGKTARRGRLKVFLGAAPGVGKTCAMLEDAARRRKAGCDVVIGVVETHGRAETLARTAGLEIVPRILPDKSLPPRAALPGEMDIDAILTRRPALVLVDELAHTNMT
ncbi:MAG TPA: histidine kinase, partial [Novosphingobium sp.]|nr:histidine kinase [Novosphingobium sp.]